ncbi:hypothetical protein FQZ97_871870 [compost metagenome]
MLAAEFAFTIAPAAGGKAAGETVVDAGRVDGDGGAEAVAGDADALRVDFLAPCQECKRVLGVGDLIEAAHLGPLAFAFAAAAEVESQRDIAEGFHHLGLDLCVALVLGTDEAMAHNEGRQPLAGLAVVRNVQNGGKLQPVGHEGQIFLHLDIL